MAGGLNLDSEDLVVPELEAPAGAGRRIDVEVGFTVIETKRDLRRQGIRSEAEPQLAGYVAQREETTGQRYVGILTDGVEWVLFYREPGGTLKEVSSSAPPPRVRDGRRHDDRPDRRDRSTRRDRG